MNDKIKVTMLFKTLNYTNEIRFSTGGAAGRSQLIKSLKHSLRIPSASHKKLEWVDEMSHKNFIWTAKTGVVPLQTLSTSQREVLLKNVSADAEVSTIGNANRSLLVKLRSKLKNSIKNSCRSETDEAVVRAFQHVLNVKGVVDVNEFINPFTNLTISRKSQKLDTIINFLKCHNDIEQSGRFAIRKNNAVVQEAFFKFPSRNKVTGISPEDRINLIKGFYDKLFPEYPVYFVVLHGDEDIDGERFSDHPHLFISTKNSKSGLYDLKATQIRRVNSYLKRYHPATKLISEKPDFSESQILFGYLQEMFYAYTNNTLLKNTQYQACKLEKTVEHNNKLRRIRKEAFKPKSERSFNLYQLSKQKAIELEVRLSERDKELKRIELELSAAEKRVDTFLAIERTAQELAAEAIEETASRRRELSATYAKLNTVRSEYASLSYDYKHVKSQFDGFMSSISGMIESLMLWLESLHNSRRHQMERKYLGKAADFYRNIVENDDTPTKSYTETADKALEAQMDFMEKLISSFSDAPSRADIIKKIKRK